MKNQIIDTFLEGLHAHREAHDRIYDDYLEGDSKMLDAIMVEDKRFTEEIESLKGEDSSEDFDGIIDTLHALDEVDCLKLLDFIYEVDDDEIIDFMTAKGYAFIKIDSRADKEKLEEFVTTEIYPHYNDRHNFSI